MFGQAGAQTRIVVVGPCAAGKSTLVGNLTARGYDARSCAQEHSAAPGLWRRRYSPQVLVYLDASLETIVRRQPRDDWTQYRLDQQHQRLADARQHCSLYVDTDDLTRQGVAETVIAYLSSVGIAPLEKG